MVIMFLPEQEQAAPWTNLLKQKDLSVENITVVFSPCALNHRIAKPY